MLHQALDCAVGSCRHEWPLQPHFLPHTLMPKEGGGLSFTLRCCHPRRVPALLPSRNGRCSPPDSLDAAASLPPHADAEGGRQALEVVPPAGGEVEHLARLQHQVGKGRLCKRASGRGSHSSAARPHGIQPPSSTMSARCASASGRGNHSSAACPHGIQPPSSTRSARGASAVGQGEEGRASTTSQVDGLCAGPPAPLRSARGSLCDMRERERWRRAAERSMPLDPGKQSTWPASRTRGRAAQGASAEGSRRGQRSRFEHACKAGAGPCRRAAGPVDGAL